jgi:hypothetical protein
MTANGVDTLPTYRDTPDHGIDPGKEQVILAAWAAIRR